LPQVRLTLEDAKGLSDDEIASALMRLHLDYFNTPAAPDWCRVDGYTIDRVYYDAKVLSPPIVPQGDIMRVVLYSMRLIQIPNFWMSLAGEVDPQNWLHTAASLAVFRSADGYTMKFAYP